MNEKELAKLTAKQGMEMFLRNFSHVPDEKLTWAPAPGAKSALQIASHTAVYYSRFATMIRERQMPVVDDLDSWLQRCQAEEDAVTTREQVELVFQLGMADLEAAIDGLSEDDVASTLDTGQGWTMAMGFLIRLPGLHSSVHMGQIDYLQTCWDDQQVYV